MEIQEKEFIPNNYVEQTRLDTDEILEYAIELIKTAGENGLSSILRSPYFGNSE